jgi:diguanylate cyclase (GGDEF)-like protein/PAS domain S-box-containing protein
MNIDIHTLALVLSLSFLLQVIALFAQYRFAKTYSGPGWWTSGSMAIAFGFVFNYLRDHPDFGPAAIISSNALFVIGLCLHYVGVLRFLQHRGRLSWLIAFCACITLIAAYFTFINENIALRRVNLSFAQTMVSWLIARAFFLNKNNSVKFTAYFLALVYLAHGGFFMVKGLNSLGGNIGTLFTPTLIQVATYLTVLVTSTLWTFGFILMSNQRLNAETREAKENAELIFNTSPDAIVITRLEDGSMVDVNEGFTLMTGFKRNEVLGKTTLDLKIWKTSEHRDAFINKLETSGFCENLEAVFQRKDGSQLIGLLSAKKFQMQGVPHLLGVIRDITERKEVEEALKESENRFRSVMEEIPNVAVQGYDLNGTVLFWNRASENLYGYTEHEALGNNLLDLIIPQDMWEIVKQGIRLMKETGEPIPAGELSLKRKDGTSVPVFSCHALLVPVGRQPELFCLDIDLTERKRLEELLHQQATTDELTGITNRRRFIELAESGIKRAIRLQRPLSIALIDMDDFKKINDGYGHSTGDQALLAFTEICLKNIREIDVLARFGGDEFVLLLPEITENQAFDVVERIRRALGAKLIDLGGKKVQLTISSGISSLDGPNDNLDSLLERADQALYRAKESGRNRVMAQLSIPL